MKYIALLSGGKDSCYNLLHCHRNGHELVAAASLRPEHGKGACSPHFPHVHSRFSQWITEELDSYLYQTVGQDAIEFVARALDVPLYRRIISGTALVQDSEYGGRDVKERGGVDGDETEDLYALLADVKVTQTLSIHAFSLVEHIICYSLNILTQRASRSGPSFQTTNASA
jgi:diphthine-ammonia ligase